MSVDIFTLSQFESALPRRNATGEALCQHVGLVAGEHEFRMRIDDQTAITIRSSVNASGVSASTGEDSIRAWLIHTDGTPLGSKVSKWTTRLPGWDTRLCDVLRTLWQWRKKAGNCPVCNHPKVIFKVKKQGPNQGRIFAKCENCENFRKDNGFVWLTDVK